MVMSAIFIRPLIESTVILPAFSPLSGTRAVRLAVVPVYVPPRMLVSTQARAPPPVPGGQYFRRLSAFIEGMLTLALIAAISPTRVTTPASSNVKSSISTSSFPIFNWSGLRLTSPVKDIFRKAKGGASISGRVSDPAEPAISTSARLISPSRSTWISTLPSSSVVSAFRPASASNRWPTIPGLRRLKVKRTSTSPALLSNAAVP